MIATKRQMYSMLAAGRFGNAMPVYTTLAAAMASRSKWLGVRSLNVGDPVRLYHVPRAGLPEALRRESATHRTDLVFSEADGPDVRRVIQGELMLTHLGLHFKYTFRQEAMRVALERDSRWATGLAVCELLRRYVDPSGIDNLDAILGKWPNAVVEFVEYGHPMGTHPACTVIWEVREY